MSTDVVSSLRQRMIEDMNARKLCTGTQKGHIRSCKQFAAFLKRSPDTATSEDITASSCTLPRAVRSICNRNRIMTGLRFLFRVTLQRELPDRVDDVEKVFLTGELNVSTPPARLTRAAVGGHIVSQEIDQRA